MEAKKKLNKPDEVTINGSVGPFTVKVGIDSKGRPLGRFERRRDFKIGVGGPFVKAYVKAGLKSKPGEE